MHQAEEEKLAALKFVAGSNPYHEQTVCDWGGKLHFEVFLLEASLSRPCFSYTFIVRELVLFEVLESLYLGSP